MVGEAEPSKMPGKANPEEKGQLPECVCGGVRTDGYMLTQHPVESPPQKLHPWASCGRAWWSTREKENCPGGVPVNSQKR